jgi:uncharacterized membrane protein
MFASSPPDPRPLRIAGVLLLAYGVAVVALVLPSVVYDFGPDGVAMVGWADLGGICYGVVCVVIALLMVTGRTLARDAAAAAAILTGLVVVAGIRVGTPSTLIDALVSGIVCVTLAISWLLSRRDRASTAGS